MDRISEIGLLHLDITEDDGLENDVFFAEAIVDSFKPGKQGRLFETEFFQIDEEFLFRKALPLQEGEVVTAWLRKKQKRFAFISDADEEDPLFFLGHKSSLL